MSYNSLHGTDGTDGNSARGFVMIIFVSGLISAVNHTSSIGRT